MYCSVRGFSRGIYIKDKYFVGVVESLRKFFQESLCTAESMRLKNTPEFIVFKTLSRF